MSRFSGDAVRDVVDPRSVPARLRESFTEFLHTEVAGAVALLLATAIALIIANSPAAAAYEHFWHLEAGIAIGDFHLEMSLVHWVNDALMALFFFVVGLEIKREVLVGELSAPRKAILPIVAALGGMIVPATIYLAFNFSDPTAHGWGVPMATDIAFAIGIMALLGDRVPSGLKVFLVALAIADDLGAILVIAFAYTSGIVWGYLVLAAFLFIVLMGFNRSGVDSPWPYFLVGGLLWLAVLLSGVHSTIAGVLVALTIPTAAKLDPLVFTRATRERLDRIEAAHVEGQAALVDNEQQLVAMEIRREARHTASPLQRLEFTLHPWTTYLVLPLFALSNAGVRIVGVDLREAISSPVALGVILGLVVGKPLGVSLATWLATATGVASLPDGVRWRQLISAGILAGIGFTMSLFIASIAFRGAAEINESKIAILVASLIAGIVGYLAMRLTSPLPPARGAGDAS